MNKQRRKILDDIVANLEREVALLANVEEEEQEAFDALPEGLQESERGQEIQNAAESLQCAREGLEDCISQIHEALE